MIKGGKLGLTTAALIVGCAGGAAMREVVFPARAAVGGSGYGYKVVDLSDLVETVRQRNPVFAKADNRAAFEEGLVGFGRAGWRFVGCVQPGAYGGGYTSRSFFCDQLIFEQGGSSAPPAVAMAPGPPPDVVSPSHH